MQAALQGGNASIGQAGVYALHMNKFSEMSMGNGSASPYSRMGGVAGAAKISGAAKGGGFGSMMEASEAARYAKYWQNYAPKQVTPGTTRLDWLRQSGWMGRLENSRVIYDNYGRQIYRVDFSDHMRPLNHSTPHLHQYQYGPMSSFGKESVFNFFGKMKKIENIEKITSVYNTWKPSDIAFIKSFEWSIQNLVMFFYCQLRGSENGWPDTSKDFFEVSIKFTNVSSLKLDFNGSGLHQILGFDILNISDNGLEKINFQIEDYENDSISFVCEEVEINEVSNPIKMSIV